MVPGRRRIRFLVIRFVIAYFFGFAATIFLLKFTRIPHVFTREKGDFLDPIGHVKVDESNAVSLEEMREFRSHKHAQELGQDTLANALYSKVRVLCWIMTSPQNLQKKTVHIKATWAGRCNKVLYISSEANPDFPTIKVKSQEGRKYLWQKTRHTFQLIYDEYLDEADWFIKADDDTYVIVENLRYFLSKYDPSQPIYFGHKFKARVKQGYMSGGGGYVISKEGLKRLIEKSFADPKLCWPGSHVGGAEDVGIGKCLEKAGVEAGDSRDALGRDTFHAFNAQGLLKPHTVPQTDWYYKWVFYQTSLQMGPECCSDYSITFHYVAPNNMYLYEYLIYHLKPFGVGYYTCPKEAQSLVTKLLEEEGKARLRGRVEQKGKGEIAKEEKTKLAN